MGWVFASLLVVVLVATFVIGTGRGGEQAPALEDRPVPAVPEAAELDPGHLAGLRFAVVTRGYSMPQVDELLRRVEEAWAADRAELEALREASARQPSAQEPADGE